jgi:hypothetical protein
MSKKPRKKAGTNIKRYRNYLHTIQKGRCCYCGVLLLPYQMTIDHELPQVRYPEYRKNLWNLRGSCTICNTEKGCSSLEEFRLLMKKNSSLHRLMFFNFGISESIWDGIFFFEKLEILENEKAITFVTKSIQTLYD